MVAIDIILLLLGLSVLVLGARMSVNQAVLIAQHYRLSDVFIGVGILALGSDLPELVISIDASLHQFQNSDTSGLIIGNAIGSSFSQIGLIMGVVGLFGYLTLGRNQVFHHGGVLLGAILFLLLAALDMKITRVEGIILILAFVLYIFVLYGVDHREEEEPKRKRIKMLRTWAILALSLSMVVGGSEVTVRSAISLAAAFGISQSFIGIVIIGIGTSLPELAISIGAMLKSRSAMSVGNLIGSNIFDTLVPVGLAATIYPLNVEHALVNVDIPLLFALTFVVLALFLWRKGLQRTEAITLVALYGAYLVIKVLGINLW